MASCRVTTVDEYSVQKTWKNSSYNFHRSFSILWYHRFYGKFNQNICLFKDFEHFVYINLHIDEIISLEIDGISVLSQDNFYKM